jgi:hypothetical protein
MSLEWEDFEVRKAKGKLPKLLWKTGYALIFVKYKFLFFNL